MSDLTKSELANAWRRFHDAQNEALSWMTNSERFQQWPQHRAKAYHAMMEAIAMAYNFAVAPRMDQPRLQTNTGWFADMYTLGQNGPDLFYCLTFLDGAQDYQLTGNVGACPLILFQILNHLSGHPDSRVIGNYDFADFDIAPDGSFEIAISAREQPGNWMRLDPDCDRHFILMRRFMSHPSDRAPVVRLTRTSPLPSNHYDAEEFDEETMAKRIDTAAAYLKYLIHDFNMQLFSTYSKVGGGYNNMAFLPGTVTSQVGSPTSNYAMAVFDLEEDEALIITLNPLPDGVYWGFQLGDVWSRSLNFTQRQTSLNMSSVVADDDGACRVIVAHKDPGISNWLDTTGRRQGTVVFRNYKTLTQPVPSTLKVKLTDLAKHLPPSTKRVSADQRAAALEARRLAYIDLHGE